MKIAITFEGTVEELGELAAIASPLPPPSPTEEIRPHMQAFADALEEGLSGKSVVGEGVRRHGHPVSYTKPHEEKIVGLIPAGKTIFLPMPQVAKFFRPRELVFSDETLKGPLLITKIQVGVDDQLVLGEGETIPPSAIHGERLPLDTVAPGIQVGIAVHNPTSEESAVSYQFEVTIKGETLG